VRSQVYELGGHAYRDPTLVGKVLEYFSIDGGDIGQFVKEVYFRGDYRHPLPVIGDTEYGYLMASDLGDEGLAKLIPELSRLSKPFKLTLIGTSITDAGMKGLGDVGVLESLDLTGTQIADEGIARLRGAKGLRKLDISDTDVTDQVIPDLVELDLTELDVSFTLMTSEGVRRLRELKPECDITAVGFDDREYYGGRRKRYGGFPDSGSK
jgi:hypothetical protein